MLYNPENPGKPITDKEPRLIQGHYNSYYAKVGPQVYSYQKHLAKVSHWTKTGDPEDRSHVVYASGMTAEDLGKWFHKVCELLGRHYVVVSEDQKRLDARYGKGPTHSGEYEMSFFIKPGVMVTLRMNATKIGTTPHGVHYRIKFTMDSGNNTTNVLDTKAVREAAVEAIMHAVYINLARACGAQYTEKTGKPFPDYDSFTYNPWSWIRAAAGHFKLALDTHWKKEFGVPFDFDYYGIITGDDFLLLASESCFQMLLGTYGRDVLNRQEYNLVPKYLYSRNGWDAEFCSGRFYQLSEDEYVFGPKLGRILLKSFKCDNSGVLPRPDDWLRDVVISGNIQYGHIPIASELFRRMAYLIGIETEIHDMIVKRDYSKLKLDPNKFNTQFQHKYTDKTKEMVRYLYDLTSDELESAIHFMATLPYVQCVYYHPVVDKIIKIDAFELMEKIEASDPFSV